MDQDEELSQSLSDLSSFLSSLELSNELLNKARSKIVAYHPKDTNDMTKQIIESFIDNLQPDGSKVLCQHIIGHSRKADPYSLGDHLTKAILSPMKACGGRTPATSDSIFGNRDDMAADMEQRSTRTSLCRVKSQCLIRDGYRCVLSGRFAKEARGKLPDSYMRKRMISVSISDVIPFTLGPWGNDTEVKKKSNAWTTLFALFPSIKDDIKPEEINVGHNVMIMSSVLNDEFGALELAIEPTDDDKTYNIVTYPNFSDTEKLYLPPADEHGKRLVTFRHQGGPLELPSRILLSTHAAIARILHASGMAEVIDRVLEDAADIRCLASDGSTNLQLMLPALLAC